MTETLEGKTIGDLHHQILEEDLEKTSEILAILMSPITLEEMVHQDKALAEEEGTEETIQEVLRDTMVTEETTFWTTNRDTSKKACASNATKKATSPETAQTLPTTLKTECIDLEEEAPDNSIQINLEENTEMRETSDEKRTK